MAQIIYLERNCEIIQDGYCIQDVCDLFHVYSVQLTLCV